MVVCILVKLTGLHHHRLSPNLWKARNWWILQKEELGFDRIVSSVTQSLSMHPGCHKLTRPPLLHLLSRKHCANKGSVSKDKWLQKGTSATVSQHNLPLVASQVAKHVLSHLPGSLNLTGILIWLGIAVVNWQKSIPLHSDVIPHCCKVSYCFLEQCLYIVASNTDVRAWPSDTSSQALKSRIATEMMTEQAAVSLKAAGVFVEVCPPQLWG